jgi:hypothetical protein
MVTGNTPPVVCGGTSAKLPKILEESKYYSREILCEIVKSFLSIKNLLCCLRENSEVGLLKKIKNSEVEDKVKKIQCGHSIVESID